MDAYSYLLHEHVFATGQTGNVALLGMRLAAGDLPGVGHYLVPIVSFVVGIVLSKHILASVHGGERHPMMRWVALFEAAAFLIIALLPSSAPDLLVNSFISFCAALSYENFRLFGTRSAYSSVFCTGNLRSLGETPLRRPGGRRPSRAAPIRPLRRPRSLVLRGRRGVQPARRRRGQVCLPGDKRALPALHALHRRPGGGSGGLAARTPSLLMHPPPPLARRSAATRQTPDSSAR